MWFYILFTLVTADVLLNKILWKMFNYKEDQVVIFATDIFNINFQRIVLQASLTIKKLIITRCASTWINVSCSAVD